MKPAPTITTAATSAPIIDKASDLAAEARNVILKEAKALEVLADAIDAKSLEQLVSAMIACRGRVIVTGMGKSGHIGRKLAATLSSTGTPAYFVHPGEASHGDLGQVTSEDMVIAMSNSGETSELANFVSYCRRNAITLVAMTFAKESTLARSADIAIVMPVQPEVCPNNLAPTTSTTMMLAFSDALSVVLLGQRNFSTQDFRKIHPGGQLGRRLLRVAELMKKDEDLPIIDENTSLKEGLVEITTKRLGCVGITSKGKLVGIVTDGDLRRMLEGMASLDPLAPIKNLISNKKVVTIDENSIAEDAIRIMNSKKIMVLFVVDAARQPIGAVHMHDCLAVKP